MKNWTLDTSIKWKDRKDITNLVFLVSEWCKNNLESSKELPMIWTDWEINLEKYGHYDLDDNEITIYPKTSDDVRDIIDTVIHEWVHFLQDNKILLESLERYKYAIDLNPNEIEAEKIAKQNTKKCWKDIRNNPVKLY